MYYLIEKVILPSSSSLASSPLAFLSLSCIITCFAREAKVRFIGVVREVVGSIVEAAANVEGADESMGIVELLCIGVEDLLGGVKSDFLSEATENGFVESFLEDAGRDADSEVGGDSIGVETM